MKIISLLKNPPKDLVNKQTVTVFILMAGEKIWDSEGFEGLDVSILSLLWVVLDAEQTEPELLLSAGSDKRVRVWKRKEEEKGLLGGLTMWGMFSGQSGVVLALAQNSTYLATASGKNMT